MTHRVVMTSVMSDVLRLAVRFRRRMSEPPLVNYDIMHVVKLCLTSISNRMSFWHNTYML